MFKSDKYKVGWGYSIRPPDRTLSIVVHSTNGAVGSSFKNEYDYLFNSRKVSAHWLIGKDGRVEHILEDRFAAWHAGIVNDVRFSNNNSIGIEIHYTPSENRVMPDAMRSLTAIVQSYHNQNPSLLVETHRKIAAWINGRPRKFDPSFLTDSEFYLWREITLQQFSSRRLHVGAYIYTAPNANSTRATHITNEYAVQGMVTKAVIKTCKRENAGWFWISDGVGFIRVEDVT